MHSLMSMGLEERGVAELFALSWDPDRDLATDATQEIMRRCSEGVRATILHTLGHKKRYLTDDVLQEVWLKIFTSHSFVAGKEVVPWAKMIARNAAVDAMRRKQERSMMSLEAPRQSGATLREIIPDERVAKEESNNVRWLRGALLELSEDHRNAIQLVYFESHTFVEAAEKLGIALSTCKQRVYNGVKHLNKLWLKDSALASKEAA